MYIKDPEVIGVYFLMQMWKTFDKLSFGAIVTWSAREFLNYLCHTQLFILYFIENWGGMRIRTCVDGQAFLDTNFPNWWIVWVAQLRSYKICRRGSTGIFSFRPKWKNTQEWSGKLNILCRNNHYCCYYVYGNATAGMAENELQEGKPQWY